MHLDPERSQTGGPRPTVWLRTEFASPSRLADGRTYTRLEHRVTLSCRESRYKMDEAFIYEGERYVDQTDEVKDWSAVLPETPMWMLFQRVCEPASGAL